MSLLPPSLYTTFACDTNPTANGPQLCLDSLPKGQPTSATFSRVIQQVLITIGAVAVLMIVIAGIRYAASQGSPDQTAQAKNTIIYAIVGLVIVIFAYSIVGFVTGYLLK